MREILKKQQYNFTGLMEAQSSDLEENRKGSGQIPE